MGVMHLELPEDLAGPVEDKAAELNVDASSFVAAIIREKLDAYDPERASHESDEDHEANAESLNAVFATALKIFREIEVERPDLSDILAPEALRKCILG
jgi:hypothetical protein